MISESRVDQMTVRIFESNSALGQAAARDFAEIVRRTAAERGEVAVIFATGNSQLTFMAALPDEAIPWNQVVAFHMDEYLGMPESHPASFQRFLREKLVDRVH